MKKTVKAISRGRGRPVTTGKGEQIAVRILPDLMKALDKHVKASGAVSRPAAIRDIVADRLRADGLLK